MSLYLLVFLIGSAVTLSALIFWFQGASVHVTYSLLLTAGSVFLADDLATGHHGQSIADGAALAYAAGMWWWAARRQSGSGLTEVQKNWRAFHGEDDR